MLSVLLLALMPAEAQELIAKKQVFELLFFSADSVKRTAGAIKANGAPVELVELDGKRGHLDGVLSIKQAEKAIAAFVAR